MSTRGVDPERPRCPTGCGRTVKAGHLLCPRCWGVVPTHVQREVWRTFRAWQRTHDDNDWTDYLTARAKALDSFR